MAIKPANHTPKAVLAINVCLKTLSTEDFLTSVTRMAKSLLSRSMDNGMWHSAKSQTIPDRYYCDVLLTVAARKALVLALAAKRQNNAKGNAAKKVWELTGEEATKHLQYTKNKSNGRPFCVFALTEEGCENGAPEGIAGPVGPSCMFRRANLATVDARGNVKIEFTIKRNFEVPGCKSQCILFDFPSTNANKGWSHSRETIQVNSNIPMMY